MSRTPNFAKALKACALGLPGAYEDSPWGDCVAKVNKKIFVFLPTDEKSDARIVVKLRDSHDFASSVGGATPTGYGLGRAGWLTIVIRESGLPPELFKEWIEESYRLIAPKRLIAELDAGRG